MRIFDNSIDGASRPTAGIGREGGTAMLKAYLQTTSIWIDLDEAFAYPFKAT